MPPEPASDLARFVAAQATDYPRALAELRAGRKETHWMWYILPQLRGLGSSSRASFYGIGSAAEAQAYLAHPVLGPRLKECVAAMNALEESNPAHVLGHVDAAKFRSCLTLFRAVAPQDADFARALDKFYRGMADQRTIALLEPPNGAG
jgi:uncharacterized protein (DUF1810 family)